MECLGPAPWGLDLHNLDRGRLQDCLTRTWRQVERSRRGLGAHYVEVVDKSLAPNRSRSRNRAWEPLPRRLILKREIRKAVYLAEAEIVKSSHNQSFGKSTSWRSTRSGTESGLRSSSKVAMHLDPNLHHDCAGAALSADCHAEVSASTVHCSYVLVMTCYNCHRPKQHILSKGRLSVPMGAYVAVRRRLKPSSCLLHRSCTHGTF